MSNTLITMASWEKRFLLGLERDLERDDIDDVLMFWSAEHDEWTAEARREARGRCKCTPVRLQLDKPKECWLAIRVALQKVSSNELVLNITTMPREVIWIALWVLESRNVKVSCVYYPPEGYGDWLTKDHGKPRIVYKLGGELSLGVPTKLLVISGYEEQRIRQMIQVYEPTEIMLGYHDGSTTHDSTRQPVQKGDFPDAELLNLSDFAFDVCAPDWGLSALKSTTEHLFRDANVLMASLGPKVTAISLFQLHRQHANSSLVYIPPHSYSKDYSSGIGNDTYTCKVDFTSPV